MRYKNDDDQLIEYQLFLVFMSHQRPQKSHYVTTCLNSSTPFFRCECLRPLGYMFGCEHVCRHRLYFPLSIWEKECEMCVCVFVCICIGFFQDLIDSERIKKQKRLLAKGTSVFLRKHVRFSQKLGVGRCAFLEVFKRQPLFFKGVRLFP